MESQWGQDPWKIIETSLPKEEFRFSESIMSIGNGHMGMRGNFEEHYSGDHHRGSYIAGVWFPDQTKVGWWKNGYPLYFGKVINSTNYIGIRVFIDDEEIDLHTCNVLTYVRELNLQTGVLTRKFSIEQNGKITDVEVIRFLSIVNRELAVIRYTVTPVNYDGNITFIPYLDGTIHNEDAHEDETFWNEINSEVADYYGHLVLTTKDSPFEVPTFQVATTMYIEMNTEDSSIQTSQRDKYIENVIQVNAKSGTPIHLIKYVAVTTDREYHPNQLVPKGKELLAKATQLGFDQLLKTHEQAWKQRWQFADVEIHGDAASQQGIRFNLFQLFATYYGEDARLNIGPKGFTGEKYGGATYWDTEAFVLPLYLSTAKPDVARNLCLYRFNQLDGAFHNAEQQGLKGALYPMVTFNGIECHNEWEITFEEIHRNAAIAFGIFQYVRYTGDLAYLFEYGIDVLVAISRFWADRVHFHHEKKLYMIHGVTGPNEYENNVNNNWYTNRMAVWTLQYTLDVVKQMQDASQMEQIEKLQLFEQEMETWRDIVDNMYFPYDAKMGIFVQHDTFLDKKLQTVDELSDADRPLNQNWSWDKILRSCFIKQADVLQGMYFLNDQFSIEEKRRNFLFYEPMTVHESSLSPSVHAILAAELGMEEKAYELYQRSARLDLDNYNNDTEDGLHITSMAGSWLAIVYGFAGMRVLDHTIAFSPFIPKEWDGYSFRIIYREHHLKIDVSQNKLTLSQQGSNFSIKVYEQFIEVPENGEISIPLMSKGEQHE